MSLFIYMMPDKPKVIIVTLLLTAFSFYSAFLYTGLPVTDYSINQDTSSGKLVWQQYNCAACYQIYGLRGYLGPDITHVYLVRGPDYIRSIMKNKTNIIPNLYLSEKELNSLVTYLKTRDRPGKSDVRTFKIKNDGTIEQ